MRSITNGLSIAGIEMVFINVLKEGYEFGKNINNIKLTPDSLLSDPDDVIICMTGDFNYFDYAIVLDSVRDICKRFGFELNVEVTNVG